VPESRDHRRVIRFERAAGDGGKAHGTGAEAAKDATFFAWTGAIEGGGLHYYRIQTPGFLIEMDCTQDQGNHIHSVWRDYENDFGFDLLKAHYNASKPMNKACR
jgi:hypothetical protein